MAVIPKRTKYRRPHRLPYDGRAKGNTELHFGTYGLQALEAGLITANQIEAARIAMTRYIKRGGKVWIKIFPDKPITKKPNPKSSCPSIVPNYLINTTQ
jgi:large subunit ribosomal protein L16